MEHFTPVSSLFGGIAIGLSATALLATLGRIAGISGIVGGLYAAEAGDRQWRLAFVAGLLAGGAGAAALAPEALAMTLERSTVALAAGGLLVGFGTRLGNGCTSGHGVCGLARGSRRSLAATLTFMTSGMVTVLLTHRWFEGTP